MIVSELLYEALRLAGVVQAAGRSASAAEMTDAFSTLNSLVDGWNADGLAVYAIEKRTVSLTGGTAEYTIGTGGAFNFARPAKIESAQGVVGTPDLGIPIKVCTPQEWAAIQFKGEASNLGPRNLYYEATHPLGKVYFHPIPSVNMSAALYVWSQLAAFASQGATVSLPVGYQRAIIYNLAVELGARPRFVRFQPDPMVAMKAQEFKAAMAALNVGLHGIQQPVAEGER